ncbi:zinc finger protein 185-like isoform X3 [Scleropages formosus]|uniref:zinc finger protein 185-like isoform X3 n=1 Tax=Scleropages formosus TaxID=113540 RepID=UPI0010FACD0C|nr:zinc finger protein 185-like isoform X3 [Scleropages formosus]
MSKEADRETVLRSMKVRTFLKRDGSWIKHHKNVEEEEEEKSRRTTEWRDQQRQLSFVNEPKTAISPPASPGITNTASTNRAQDNNECTSAETLKDVTTVPAVTSEPIVSPQEAALESAPLKGSVKGNTSGQEALPKIKADVRTLANTPNAPDSKTQRSMADVPIKDISSLEDNSSLSVSIPEDTVPKVEIPDSSAAQCIVTDAKEVPSPEHTSSPAACFSDAEEHKPSTLQTSKAPEPSATTSTVTSDCTQAVPTKHTKDISTPHHSSPSAHTTTEDQIPEWTLQDSAKPELINQEAPPEDQMDIPRLPFAAKVQEPTARTSAECETSTEGAPSQGEGDKSDELTAEQASGPEEPERKPRTSSTDNKSDQDKATVIAPTASTEKTMENLENKVQDPPSLESRPEESTEVPEEKCEKLERLDIREPPSTEKSETETPSVTPSAVKSSNVCTICGKPFTEDCRITLNHLNISWHTDCFKCVVCSKPMGDLLQNMYLRGDMVCCESCYFNIS